MSAPCDGRCRVPYGAGGPLRGAGSFPAWCRRRPNGAAGTCRWSVPSGRGCLRAPRATARRTWVPRTAPCGALN